MKSVRRKPSFTSKFSPDKKHPTLLERQKSNVSYVVKKNASFRSALKNQC